MSKALSLFLKVGRLVGKRHTHNIRQPRQEAVILSASRTCIGSFNGSLSSLTSPQLSSIAIKDALKKAGVEPNDVDESIQGNVLSAGLGQAPTRQATRGAGLGWSVVCTGVNKVCASGLKAVNLAAQSIENSQNRLVIAGGFESMSNVPYYLPPATRSGLGYGHATLLDGVLKDGLWDAHDDQHMGMCAEVCATQYGFSRQQQDDFALESFRRAKEATEGGLFGHEIVNVEVKLKGISKVVNVDENIFKLNPQKVPTLKPAFKSGGSVTAANSSALNDGAAALVLSSATYATNHGLKPLARILSYADAEKAPIEFTTAPALAIPKALERAGLSARDVDYYEINEAFAVVALANIKLLNLDPQRVNIYGGAVALGHPIGCSGARILVTLLNVLKQKKANIGVAAVCNGGGGATALVIQRCT